MSALRGKIDFTLFISADNANPNGDPLNGNRPRINLDGYGEISDVCIKRKIRNRLQDLGQKIFVQSDDRSDDGYTSLKDRADGCEELKAQLGNKKNANRDACAAIACKEWLDVRAFGQVFARNFILGKVYNSRWVLERAARDYALRLDVEKIKRKSAFLAQSIVKIRECESAEELLGIEGEAASVYFSVFDDLILQQKTDFYFQGRNKRPPLDSVNAMLSFAYSLLAGMCGSALEAVGLDSYVGFFHTDRPGRISLALDLMEEFRSVMADRFVLTLINKKIMKPEYFIKKENGAVIMNDEGRKVFLSAWQSKKQETIKHPFLGEKIEWGMAPYVQSLLLARFLRGDLDEYPPFFWK